MNRVTTDELAFIRMCIDRDFLSEKGCSKADSIIDRLVEQATSEEVENARQACHDFEVSFHKVAEGNMRLQQVIAELKTENNHLKNLIKMVYDDLPSNRDWLDPIIEQEMKDSIKEA